MGNGSLVDAVPIGFSNLGEVIADVNCDIRRLSEELKAVQRSFRAGTNMRIQEVEAELAQANENRLAILRRARPNIETEYRVGNINKIQYEGFRRELVRSEAQVVDTYLNSR